MSEYIIIHTGPSVSLPILLSEGIRKMIQRLVRSSEHITAGIARFILHLTRMSRPRISQTESPARMQRAEQNLKCAVVKSPAYQSEHSVSTTQAVSVPKTEQAVVYPYNVWLRQHSDSQLFLKIIIYPHIVIASEEINLDSAVTQPGKSPESPGISAGDNISVLIPEIKNIPQQIHTCSPFLPY